MDTVKWEAPPGVLHAGKNNAHINISFIKPAIWRLPVNSINKDIAIPNKLEDKPVKLRLA